VVVVDDVAVVGLGEAFGPGYAVDAAVVEEVVLSM